MTFQSLEFRIMKNPGYGVKELHAELRNDGLHYQTFWTDGLDGGIVDHPQEWVKDLEKLNIPEWKQQYLGTNSIHSSWLLEYQDGTHHARIYGKDSCPESFSSLLNLMNRLSPDTNFRECLS